MGAKHEKRFISLFDLHDSFRADLYFPFLLVAGRYLQGHVS
ncbi:putative transmembrane protein [Escherichia coli MP020980.2]|nr:putative transmembrane protein [Escherichia coli MP020980.2]KDV82944.1 putative transmembrane protein [Escherichia coli 2-052-05_S4_C2]